MGLIYPPELSHQRFAFFGQEEGAGALIMRGEPAPREAAVLKIIEEGDEIRTPDSDRLANVLLL